MMPSVKHGKHAILKRERCKALKRVGLKLSRVYLLLFTAKNTFLIRIKTILIHKLKLKTCFRRYFNRIRLTDILFYYLNISKFTSKYYNRLKFKKIKSVEKKPLKIIILNENITVLTTNKNKKNFGFLVKYTN